MFVLSKFEFIGFKPFVQASKDIIKGILKVITFRVMNKYTSIISKSIGLDSELMVGDRTLIYKKKRRGEIQNHCNTFPIIIHKFLSVSLLPP
jgi:hypothetical protein